MAPSLLAEQQLPCAEKNQPVANNSAGENVKLVIPLSLCRGGGQTQTGGRDEWRPPYELQMKLDSDHRCRQESLFSSHKAHSNQDDSRRV